MGVDVGAGAATIWGCCVGCAGCCGVGGGCGGWVCVGGVVYAGFDLEQA